jgi:hypothetical protein
MIDGQDLVASSARVQCYSINHLDYGVLRAVQREVGNAVVRLTAGIDVLSAARRQREGTGEPQALRPGHFHFP